MKKTKSLASSHVSAVPAEWITHSIDFAALRKLTMKELWALRDGIRTVGDVLSGLRCQPRFNEEVHNDICQLNGAGNLLEQLSDWLGGYEQAIANVAEEAEPTTGDEVEWRGHLLIGYRAAQADSLAEISALAAAAARDEVRARLHDKHRRATA